MYYYLSDVKESNSELIINACSTKKIGWSKTIASCIQLFLFQ